MMVNFLVARFQNCQSPAGLVEQFGDVAHKTMLSAPIFCSLLKRAGFKVISIAGAIPKSEFPNGLKEKILIAIKKGAKRLFN